MVGPAEATDQEAEPLERQRPVAPRVELSALARMASLFIAMPILLARRCEEIQGADWVAELHR